MANETSELTHWQRITYAGVLSTLIGGVIIMLSAWLAPDFMVAFITDHYWVGIFVLAYFFAPWLSRYIKEK